MECFIFILKSSKNNFNCILRRTMEKINVTNKHIKSTEFYRKMFFVLASILSLTLPLVSIIISANIIVSLKNITDFFFFLVIVFLSVVISFVSITFIFKINIYKCNREDIKFLLFYFTGHSFLIAVSILYLSHKSKIAL